jgi:hypothetical protein
MCWHIFRTLYAKEVITTMKKSHTQLKFSVAGIILSGMVICMLSCTDNGPSPAVKDQKTEQGGVDARQTDQDRDSLNLMLNDRTGNTVDTLPKGLQE